MARGGSKGVEDKNIREVGGKPLIAYTIEEVQRCGLVDRYIVSTDSTAIKEVAESCGAEVLIRPYYLAQDDTPSVDALRHALYKCEEQDNVEYDIVCHAQCTNPLKTFVDIEGAIGKLRRTGLDAVIGVGPADHPFRIKRIWHDTLVDVWPEPEHGQRHLFRPRDLWKRNGSVYAIRRDALLRGVYIGGSNLMGAWPMPRERSVNIDDEIDLLFAEALLKARDNGSL